MRFTLGLTGLWDCFAERTHFGPVTVDRGNAPPTFSSSCCVVDGRVPERCVVVEDSPFGVIAARAAGMPALGYAADGSGERLDGEGARTFRSMVELPGLLASPMS